MVDLSIGGDEMKKIHRETAITETELDELGQMIANGEKDRALGFIKSKHMSCARTINFLTITWAKD